MQFLGRFSRRAAERGHSLALPRVTPGGVAFRASPKRPHALRGSLRIFLALLSPKRASGYHLPVFYGNSVAREQPSLNGRSLASGKKTSAAQGLGARARAQTERNRAQPSAKPSATERKTERKTELVSAPVPLDHGSRSGSFIDLC